MRYINEQMLNAVSRPQYSSACSITSVAAAFNYLFSEQLGVKTVDQLARAAANRSANDIHGAGNKTLLEWFRVLCGEYSVPGEAEILVNKREIAADANNELFGDICGRIKSRDTALIYHTDNHYTVIAGMFSHASKPEDALKPEAMDQHWLIFGEHSEYNIIPSSVLRVIKQILSPRWYSHIIERTARPPIWCRTWEDVRRDISECRNHAILQFRRN